MTDAERADVNARLDALAEEVQELREQLAVVDKWTTYHLEEPRFVVTGKAGSK